MYRREAIAWFGLAMLSGAGILSAQTSRNASPCSPEAHEAWVANVLERMERVKAGMTRKVLEEAFTTEGGMYSSNMKRTFVSRDCPYFKVDVEFLPAKGWKRDEAGRDVTPENPADVIEKISTPYLQFSVED